MDLSQTRQTFGVGNQQWRLSRKGLDTPRSITILMSSLTKSLHYPDGFILSGLPLAKRTSDNIYVLYNTAGTGGAEVLDGLLLAEVHLALQPGGSVPAMVGGALQWEGVIDSRYLPPPGVDADGRAQTAGNLRFENIG